MTIKRAKSYGIIPLLKQRDSYCILLVKHSDGHWGLPKGTPKEKETSLQTASRELFEETGIRDIKIVKGVDFTERYNFEQKGVIYRKTNTYYLGFAKEKIIGENLNEIKKAKWIKLNQAKRLATYQSTREVIDEVIDYLNNNFSL